ncbi:uncharacterized protein LOC119572454 [Penaeus monodon]|uniref:uncharacterized protein LOC119572454 n=1 Tax=Penaeus monodon TaxID=6687 RepID=UPI0018A72D58|nr:uncharacterized protein LOC119572454 [Penaeus monodon]
MPNTDNDNVSPEIRQARRKMKNRKAVGPDSTPAEVWKCLGNTGLELLTGWLNNIIDTETMPDEYRDSIQMPIYKNKGDIQDCGNYRGIKLMSHTMKIWERIIHRRLRNVVNICEEQVGFMPNLEKGIVKCLNLKGITEKYVKLIQDMCRGAYTLVRSTIRTSVKFEITVGVHQGSALYPLLFATVMSCLTKVVRREVPWDIMYADNVALSTGGRKSKRQDSQCNGDTSNSVWTGSNILDQSTGKKTGGGRDENAEIGSRSNKKGYDQEKGGSERITQPT